MSGFTVKPTRHSLFIICLSALALATAAVHENLRESKMTVYLSDITVGANATYLPVAGVPGREWSLTEFGTIYSFGDFLTLSPERNAVQVGRGEGFVLVSQPGGKSWFSCMSIAFSNEEYNLSSIELQGVYNQFTPVNELAIVGGTGKFRLARGHAQFGTYSLDSSFWTVWVNITMLLPVQSSLLHSLT